VKVGRLLQEAPAITVFILCLFGGGFARSSLGIVAPVCREAEAIFKDAQTQWLVVLCIGTYLVAFAVMRTRWTGRVTRVGSIDFWRSTFLAISMLCYFRNYRDASQSTQTVILLGGAAVGSGAWANVFWRNEPWLSMRSLWRFLILTVVILTLSSFWNSKSGSKFFYKENVRWIGPCDNPNLYGLLMATGVMLDLGLALYSAGVVSATGSWRIFWKCMKDALLLAAAGLLCFGLWKSYSRGAWLGAGIGVLYLSIQWHKRHPIESTSQIRRIRVVVGIAVALTELLVLFFWQFKHTESLTARRVVSVSNQNDLSWLNRVAAWEGALQMIAEKPWLGFGWDQPESLYGYYYSASRLDDARAILINDYLMVGATLGVPALLCFGIYLSLSFNGSTRRKARSDEDLEGRQLDWLKAVCRAGALALLVGFWFDGGLFKLPTAATFWILLELGRKEGQKVQE